MDESNQKENFEGEPLTREIENNDIVETNLDETPDVIQEQREDDEEFSAELTADDSSISDKENAFTSDTNHVVGWVAIALSILSLFMMPILLGGAGIVVGFISRKRNAEWLGNTAITIGVISILISLFFLPFR